MNDSLSELVKQSTICIHSYRPEPNMLIFWPIINILFRNSHKLSLLFFLSYLLFSLMTYYSKNYAGILGSGLHSYMLTLSESLSYSTNLDTHTMKIIHMPAEVKYNHNIL